MYLQVDRVQALFAAIIDPLRRVLKPLGVKFAFSGGKSAAIIDPLRRVLKLVANWVVTIAYDAAIIDPLRRVLKLVRGEAGKRADQAAIIDPLRRVLKLLAAARRLRIELNAAIIDPLRRVLKRPCRTSTPAAAGALRSSTRCEGY